MSLDDQMADAVRRQFDHATASRQIDRRGWTRRQWIEDARSQFGDLEGSVLDLVNGHVSAMLAAIPRDGQRHDQDMRREIVLREINQGALAGMPSQISEQAADLVLAALDRYDEWALEQRGIGRPPARQPARSS